MQRIFELFLSFLGIILLSPLLIFLLFLVWLQDRKYPFYYSERVGLKGKKFKLIKIRTMHINADASKVDSTKLGDKRITPIGIFLRKYKLDEIPQLINIFLGQMSFVGPRPNVERETSLYTLEESKLLNHEPGLTDIASIVFSDEANILSKFDDPDIAYNQLIRPYKSRLGIICIENLDFKLYIKIVFLTFTNLLDRAYTLKN